ncbi:hypothetical protein CC79DRAFT_484679 [Sarocladium strictum]
MIRKVSNFQQQCASAQGRFQEAESCYFGLWDAPSYFPKGDELCSNGDHRVALLMPWRRKGKSFCYHLPDAFVENVPCLNPWCEVGSCQALTSYVPHTLAYRLQGSPVFHSVGSESAGSRLWNGLVGQGQEEPFTSQSMQHATPTTEGHRAGDKSWQSRHSRVLRAGSRRLGLKNKNTRSKEGKQKVSNETRRHHCFHTFFYSFPA